MISIRDLEFRYSRTGFGLHVPDLNVPTGERLAIIGASGSGKTTLLDLIAGIRQPGTGSVRVANEDIPRLSDKRRRAFRITNVGLVLQSFELVDYLTVRENILLPFRISAAIQRPANSNARAEHLSRATGIFQRLERMPGELSQGERQRAAICRALIAKPSLILADEPTGNLDPENKRRVLDTLLEQVSDHGATLIMVTHDHDLLQPFDRVVDMRYFHRGCST